MLLQLGLLTYNRYIFFVVVSRRLRSQELEANTSKRRERYLQLIVLLSTGLRSCRAAEAAYKWLIRGYSVQSTDAVGARIMTSTAAAIHQPLSTHQGAESRPQQR